LFILKFNLCAKVNNILINKDWYSPGIIKFEKKDDNWIWVTFDHFQGSWIELASSPAFSVNTTDAVFITNRFETRIKIMQRFPGLNFINVLSTAFTHVDPKCAKKDSQVSSVIWHFWDPCAEKLHVKSWWNCHQVSGSLHPAFDQHQQPYGDCVKKLDHFVIMFTFLAL